MEAPYELVCAVQDLYSLYQQLSPAGPYRLELFHDQTARDDYPPAVSEAAPRLDALVRGAGCLLGSKLPGAVYPVTAELWRVVQRLWRTLHPGETEPDGFRYLTYELLAASSDAGPLAAHRLFGQVLAVYLSLLCEARGDAASANRLSRLQSMLDSNAVHNLDVPSNGQRIPSFPEREIG